MTEPNSRQEKLSSVIVDMEDDMRRIALWAQVLIIMSSSCHSVQPDALSPIANALHELGTSLEVQYERACAGAASDRAAGRHAMRLILLMRLVALRRLAIHENARAAPLLKWSDEACDRAEERLREANAIPVRLGFSPL